MHDYVFSHHASADEKISLDGFALSVYQAAKQAITDIIQEKKVPLSLAAKTKLLFFHSDVLRAALRVMRAAQFLKSKASLASIAVTEAGRTRVNVDEFTAALFSWKRQLEIHLGSEYNRFESAAEMV